MARIQRIYDEPLREDQSFENRWNKQDRGLITCWEKGREIKNRRPDMAEKASRGELPVLGFKGGIAKRIQDVEKIGSLNYLAQWQGLRGEDLDVTIGEEVVIECSKTGMIVTFTDDIEKLKNG
jgi:hypothetical protein